MQSKQVFSPIMNQAFGQNWANYNADCVFGMQNLPDNSVHFLIFSPPFLVLYIYSDNIADLGNTESEQQFFDGWLYHLKEICRILKPGRYITIHCKDIMRYMSSHGYAGLYDFPGEIIRCAARAGFLYQRWITIWKDPVIEMQRTKTYGLLHKSFKERAEVTRQGCADYVLVFQKPLNDNNDLQLGDDSIKPLPNSVILRLEHQWTNEEENTRYNKLLKNSKFSVWNKPLSHYSAEFINRLSECTVPGRLATIHCQDLQAINAQGELCKYSMASEIIKRFKNQGSWKFHSRCALTDGTSLVTFRNWTSEFIKRYKDLNGIVKHDLKAPGFLGYETTTENEIIKYNGTTEYIQRKVTTPIYDNNAEHQDYIGNNPPKNWKDDSYYSILAWQKYASPIWFDLDGLPETNKDCWMNINQTNVLNVGLKSEKEQRHICPLQLDLIDKLILEYSEPGEIVVTPYGGIGSEGVGAIKRDRKAILFELKTNYWELGNYQLANAEKEKLQYRMEGF